MAFESSTYNIQADNEKLKGTLNVQNNLVIAKRRELSNLTSAE